MPKGYAKLSFEELERHISPIIKEIETEYDIFHNGVPLWLIRMKFNQNAPKGYWLSKNSRVLSIIMSRLGYVSWSKTVVYKKKVF